MQAYGPTGLGILTVSGVPGFTELRQRSLPLAQAFAVSTVLFLLLVPWLSELWWQSNVPIIAVVSALIQRCLPHLPHKSQLICQHGMLMRELSGQTCSIIVTLLKTSCNVCRLCLMRRRSCMLTLPACTTLAGAMELREWQTDSQTDTKAHTMPTLWWMHLPQMRPS